MFRKLIGFAFASTFLASTLSAANATDIVVGAFGGSFAKAVQECHIAPFHTASGDTVTMKQGNSSQFAAMIRATGGSSDFDAVYIDDSFATQLAAEGLLEKIDPSKLSSAPQLVDGVFGADDHFVQYEWSATTLVYNPKLVKTPPTSWNDVFKPEYAGKIALPDISGTAGVDFLLAVNRLKGGDIDNLDKGFAAMKELAPHAVAFYTQPDQIISMFQRGEIALAPWYPDRAAAAADSGAPVAIAYPKEGAIGIKVTMIIPKGAQHPDAALKYIDAVLSANAQKCFAEKMYEGPVNKTVHLEGNAAKAVPPEIYPTLYFPSPKVIAKNVAEWRHRWEREITH